MAAKSQPLKERLLGMIEKEREGCWRKCAVDAIAGYGKPWPCRLPPAGDRRGVAGFTRWKGTVIDALD
ncbi:MAG: hypothetical protein F9K44_11460 [Hyphomicrobiaceae bacterium]|nr:MAG: hypothetical protein F9K44_11460 [Hyphomicrobiaceae bacterium]